MAFKWFKSNRLIVLVLAFVLLVLVLIFRPTGIMGERLTVKKA